MGSSGSGAGGGGGLGGGGGGAGYVSLRGGSLAPVDPTKAEAWAAIQGVFSRLSQDYLAFVLGEPGVVSAYEALFQLHVLLVQGRSWNGVEARFGVDGGPDCLVRLVDALVAESGPHAVHPSVQAPLKAALLDFMLRIVGDNPAVRDNGNAATVLATLAPAAFQRTSNNFLTAYLFETLRIEARNLSHEARKRLWEFAGAKADQIVAAFERTYRGKPWQDVPQTSYAHLLRLMKGEPDWAVKRLRTKLAA